MGRSRAAPAGGSRSSDPAGPRARRPAARAAGPRPRRRRPANRRAVPRGARRSPRAAHPACRQRSCTASSPISSTSTPSRWARRTSWYRKLLSPSSASVNRRRRCSSSRMVWLPCRPRYQSQSWPLRTPSTDVATRKSRNSAGSWSSTLLVRNSRIIRERDPRAPSTLRRSSPLRLRVARWKRCSPAAQPSVRRASSASSCGPSGCA